MASPRKNLRQLMFAELNVLMTRVAEHAHSFYRCVGNFMNLEETLYLPNANVEKGSLRGFTKLRIIKPAEPLGPMEVAEPLNFC